MGEASLSKKGNELQSQVSKTRMPAPVGNADDVARKNRMGREMRVREAVERHCLRKGNAAVKALKPGLLILAIVGSSAALAADWQYAGVAGDADAFFDADSVSRSADNRIEVRLKGISSETLRRHYFENEAGLRGRAVQRTSNGYVPRFLQLEPMKKRYSGENKYGINLELEAATNVMTSHEMQANGFDIPVKWTVYLEIDCKEKRLRTLDVAAFDESGNLTKSAPVDSAWGPVSPGTNGELLSMMPCKGGP